MSNPYEGDSNSLGVDGLTGKNTTAGNGVAGFSQHGIGVRGDNVDGFAAVHGHGGKNGVWGYTVSPNDSGVFGLNDGSGNGVAGFSKSGIGVLGRGGSFAGFFDGNVQVNGDIFLPGADCAEHFDVGCVEESEPGTVMAIDDNGTLTPSCQPYNKRVAGVISGAGTLKPGIILDKQSVGGPRLPLALIGKVYCKVDARFASIQIGDLLTTSATPGHAMKACDPQKAFGSVIGKALQDLETGQGLIPILVALQ